MNKGITTTRSGHLRFKSPKEVRDVYVHRYIVKQLIQETEDNPYLLTCFVPDEYDVHHVDFDKQNNDPSNFILMDPRMHSHTTNHGQTRYRNGRMGPMRKNAMRESVLSALAIAEELGA